MMTATQPTFLYPRSRQYPFDEVCEQIVRALEERNWTVPGITVDFDLYGTGEEKYRMVRYIKGEDFKLWFCRPQARLGRWNDTAAVTEIVIPQKEIRVYDDESGPTFYTYVGKNWEEDKVRFINGSKVNSKLNGEPRWYLRYKGSCNCRRTGGASFEALGFLTAAVTGDTEAFAALSHTHEGRRSPILVHDNDLNREYEATQKEPKMYRTDDVFTEFTQWLKDNLLVKIMTEPVADEKIDLFTETVTPFPTTIGPIFCFGEHRDAQRVYQGKLDVNELDPGDRYGFIGSGYRLMSLGTSNDGTVPELAYDGFLWCGLGEVTGQTPIDTLNAPGHYRWSDRERYVFRISPTRADGIYVADHASYEMRRSELFQEIKPRDRLTDAELAEATQARARTIIPITEYTGGFEQPVILINRDLDFDEVELVSGPWPEAQLILLITRRLQELNLRDYFQIALAELEEYRSSGYRNEDREAYAKAIENLLRVFKDLGDEAAQAAETYGRKTFSKVEVNAHFMERIISAAAESRGFGLF